MCTVQKSIISLIQYSKVVNVRPVLIRGAVEVSVAIELRNLQFDNKHITILFNQRGLNRMSSINFHKVEWPARNSLLHIIIKHPFPLLRQYQRSKNPKMSIWFVCRTIKTEENSKKSALFCKYAASKFSVSIDCYPTGEAGSWDNHYKRGSWYGSIKKSQGDKIGCWSICTSVACHNHKTRVD